MKITIISMTAVVHGRPEVVWTGELFDRQLPVKDYGHISEDQSASDIYDQIEAANNFWRMKTLAHIFRLFNRVDEADVKRLDDLAYELPSLSMGDIVVFYENQKTYTYKIEALGFTLMTGDSNLVLPSA